MRRRSERKKSVEASPAASSSRRSSRRTRRSPDIEKNEDSEQQQDETPTPTKTDSSPNRASSEERIESVRRGRARRNSRTPAKRRLRNLVGADKQIDCIEEEENGVTHKIEGKIIEQVMEEVEEEGEKTRTTTNVELIVEQKIISTEKASAKLITDDNVDDEIHEKLKDREQEVSEAAPKVDVEKNQIEEELKVVDGDKSACEPKLNISHAEQNITEVLMTGTKTVGQEEKKDKKKAITMTKDVEIEPMPIAEAIHEEKCEKKTEAEFLDKTNNQQNNNNGVKRDQQRIGIDKDSDKVKNNNDKDDYVREKSNGQEEFEADVSMKEAPALEKEIPKVDQQNSFKQTEVHVQNNTNNVGSDQPRSRKRRWLSKKPSDGKDQIMAISTDSLKNLIDDVQPVPLSDVQLESSSEVEEVASERDDIIRESSSSSPSVNEPRRNILETKAADKLSKTADNADKAVIVPKTVLPALPNSPSPPRNETSNVLFITNLVRPFTVMQLKGLLARTGKIMENGFWIDRIKSKCYVQYETEDEAIETRHALHGVRWPVSNPKCLNVDFGHYADMERAIKTTSDEAPKYGQDYKENFITGSGWNREIPENDDKKINSKPIREWDVGKKESREKRDAEKREQRSPKDAEKEDKYKNNRGRQRDEKSNSLSPARKIKKEEPPLRLLDDLFRKTKAAPCIYWLPLTPEQIAEKEAFRQKRIEERKERIKQRELEREKEHELDRGRERDRSRERVKSREREKTRDREKSREREKTREREKSRERDRSRERERDRRRNRSNERRRSRSRDRRRY